MDMWIALVRDHTQNQDLAEMTPMVRLYYYESEGIENLIQKMEFRIFFE